MKFRKHDSFIKVFHSADELAESIAKEWFQLSQSDDVKHIALSGGETPKHVFGYIAHSDYASSIVWQKLHFWWGDERCVAATDQQSNYGEAMRLLFSHVLIPADNLHPIHGELESEKALIEFKDEMSACLDNNPLPVFDWVMLGLGNDGHTASLFPGQVDYELQQSAVLASQPESGQQRISISAQVISLARRVTFIALGSSKEAIVSEVLGENGTETEFPAARIFYDMLANSGNAEWYLDEASSCRLHKKKL